MYNRASPNCSHLREPKVAFETLVNRGIPTMVYGISERTFRMAHLLAAVAPRLADKLSTLNVASRICRMVLGLR